MNIVIALTYYTPHWTGLTEHANRLAKGLVSKGHSVTVVCTQHKKKLPLVEVMDGVKVVRTSIIGRLSRSVVSLSFIPTVAFHARNADLVLLYTPLAEILPLSVVLRFLQLKIIIVHNGDLLLPKGIINRGIEYFFTVSMRISGLLAHGIISYSDDYTHHSRFLKHFSVKTTAILPLFPVKKHSISKKIPYPVNRGPIVGFAGRFVEEKGFDVLLDAIPLVAKVYPNVLFMFAGEKHIEYESFYEKNIHKIENVKQNLQLLGLLNQEEMQSFYNTLDLFVLPSRSDCLAFVQVEAMLSGVPVIATNIPGARVAVQKTGMGLLVQVENAIDLAQGIIKLYKCRHLLKNAKKSAQKVFDYSKTLDEYNTYLMSMARKNI